MTTQPPAAAVAFFRKWAGSSYDPKTETFAQGVMRGARSLAAAEEWGRLNLSFVWSVDRDSDSSDFCDDKPAWSLWSCAAIGANEECVASLHAIDFGRGGEPWGQTYKRVVEAELASEAKGRRRAGPHGKRWQRSQRRGA